MATTEGVRGSEGALNSCGSSTQSQAMRWARSLCSHQTESGGLSEVVKCAETELGAGERGAPSGLSPGGQVSKVMGRSQCQLTQEHIQTPKGTSGI